MLNYWGFVDSPQNEEVLVGLNDINSNIVPKETLSEKQKKILILTTCLILCLVILIIIILKYNRVYYY